MIDPELEQRMLGLMAQPGPSCFYLEWKMEDYVYQGPITISTTSDAFPHLMDEAISIAYARIQGGKGNEWRGTITVTEQPPLELMDMMGGLVHIWTEEGVRGDAIATAELADGVWTITLTGVKIDE